MTGMVLPARDGMGEKNAYSTSRWASSDYSLANPGLANLRPVCQPA